MTEELAPLVLLPGMMCDRRLWQPVIERLGRERRIFVPTFYREKSIPSMAQNVLQQFPGTISLAGLSMGGIVALEMAIQEPSRIERLAILNSNARSEGRERRRGRVAQLRRVQSGQMLAMFNDQLLPAYFGPSRPIDPAARQTVLDMATSLGEDVFIRQARALHLRQDLLEQLHRIECPVLLITGDKDTLCPVSYHREMAEALESATLMVLQDCGHLSTIERPDHVAALLSSWLASPQSREYQTRRHGA